MKKIILGAALIGLLATFVFGQMDAGFLDSGGFYCYDSETLEFITNVPYPANQSWGTAQAWCNNI